LLAVLLILASGVAFADVPPWADLWWTIGPGDNQWTVLNNSTGQVVNPPEWDLTGQKLTVHNVALPDNIKTFWLEIKWNKVNHVVLDPVLTADGQVTSLGVVTSPNTGWTTWTWTIRPQPWAEVLDFGAPGMRDVITRDMAQFEVGSKCVPEPGTIFAALSILGPVGFVFRKRRA